MRVFISSTVYDLIDVRAELGELCRSIGIIPVLSDDKLSDFRIQQDENSIQTCLTNVESCDDCVVILNRRYGPRLGKFGFDNVSATHLEYRKAVERKIPIHVYVRDRLDADYSIWKRNKRIDSIDLSWVLKEDFGLFQLLDEHSTLMEGEHNNWYFPFTSSVDLKSAFEKYFGSRILPRRLVEAIQSNSFPLLDIDLKVDNEDILARPSLNCRTLLTNVGGSPAFNCRVRWETGEGERKSYRILAPRQSMLMVFIYGLGTSHRGATRYLVAEYDSPIGVSVRDRFEVHAHVQGGTLISGGTLVERRYIRSSSVELKIENETVL